MHELASNAAQLRQLAIWYRGNAVSGRVDTLAFWEKQKTVKLWPAAQVVDAGSADPGIPGAVPIGVEADHATICKPETRGSLVAAEVERCLKLWFARDAGGFGADIVWRPQPDLMVKRFHLLFEIHKVVMPSIAEAVGNPKLNPAIVTNRNLLLEQLTTALINQLVEIFSINPGWLLGTSEYPGYLKPTRRWYKEVYTLTRRLVTLSKMGTRPELLFVHPHGVGLTRDESLTVAPPNVAVFVRYPRGTESGSKFCVFEQWDRAQPWNYWRSRYELKKLMLFAERKPGASRSGISATSCHPRIMRLSPRTGSYQSRSSAGCTGRGGASGARKIMSQRALMSARRLTNCPMLSWRSKRSSLQCCKYSAVLPTASFSVKNGRFKKTLSLLTRWTRATLALSHYIGGKNQQGRQVILGLSQHSLVD